MPAFGSEIHIILSYSWHFSINNWNLLCRISVTFVDKDGEEKLVKVPIGMSMLEAAHENDIELEGPLQCHFLMFTRSGLKLVHREYFVLDI